MTRVLHVVGARPNLPKLAPVHRAARLAGLDQLIVHTGQHYDDALSGAFFRDLGIPKPEINLCVGSDTHAVQTARVMERIEPILRREAPDWVVVYGDVNSTMAAAIVGSKLGLRVAHVEAGLRSHDRTMPEEINRLVTDRLADLLLTPSRDADATLRAEGEPDEEIVFVGNVMIDSLLFALPAAQGTGFRSRVGASDAAVVVTLHRPSNVDDPARLASIAAALRGIAERRPVLFPVHPRTRQRLGDAALDLGAVQLMDPIGYLEMLDLVQGAHVVITDSGGLQEETTALGVPCLTVRENTERPITISEGTNRLVPDPEELARLVEEATRPAAARRPEGWDGRAGERIARALIARGTTAPPPTRRVAQVSRPLVVAPVASASSVAGKGSDAQTAAVAHFFTVDVEEYFQVSAFDAAVSRDDWHRFPSRLARSVELLLELLDRHRTSGTFFVLGWIAERHPEIVRRIAGAGHEIASHGWWHRRVCTLTPGEFREDVRASKTILETVSGRRVLGFRAPSFSIVPGTEWAFDVLLDEGYRYDSSLFPVTRPGYGYPRATPHPHVIPRAAGELLELPLATVHWRTLRMPAAGGGYFRQFPYAVTQGAFRQHTNRGIPGTFYIHPWELDDGQPRVPVSWLTRVRHYRGLRTTLPRLERLLGEFQFTSIARGMRLDPTAAVTPVAAAGC